MAEIAIVCLLGREDEAAVLAALREPELAVHRRCLDAAELEACALAGIGDVAVLDARLDGVDARLIDRLGATGIRCVAIVGGESDDAGSAARVATGDLASLPGAVLRLCRPTAPAPPAAPPSIPPMGPRPQDGLIAIVGPGGAPGRSTLAVNLAAELAHRGRAVLLADADNCGGCVAALLGMLDEAPGLLAAIRAVEADYLPPQSLDRLAPRVGALRVLSGIEARSRASELDVPAAQAVWRAAREFAEVCVVDCGADLDEPHGWGEAGAPWAEPAGVRNASRSALLAADRIVVVGRADPVGLQRLVRTRIEIAGIEPRAPITIAVNRARASAVGGRPGPTIRQVLRSLGIKEPVVLLPDDPAAVDRAVLEGRTLREASGRGVLLAAIERLADQLMSGGRPRAPLPLSKDGIDDVAGLLAQHA